MINKQNHSTEEENEWRWSEASELIAFEWKAENMKNPFAVGFVIVPRHDVSWDEEQALRLMANLNEKIAEDGGLEDVNCFLFTQHFTRRTDW